MKNEHPAFFRTEQDDIVNSLNYEGIAVIELQFYYFPDGDRPCWLCHRLNSLNDYLIMVISQPPGEHPSYYYRASPTLPQIALNASRTPYVLYIQLQHQG